MTDRVKFKKGDIIFKEGDWEMCMYDIVSGRVGIYSNYKTSGEKFITELDEGKFFGELAIAESKPRSATAVALEDTELFVVTAETFDLYFSYDPNKIVLILQNLSYRLRQLSGDFVEAVKNIKYFIEMENVKTPQKVTLLSKIIKAFSKNKAPEYIFDTEKKAKEANVLTSAKQDYKKNEIIFKQGAEENWMYDIRWGSVAIYSDFDTPEKKLLTTLQAGDYFGEMGMIDGSPRSATAVAIEESKIVMISVKNFNNYLKERPTKVLEMLQHLCKRIRDLSVEYIEAQKIINEYSSNLEVYGVAEGTTLAKMREFVFNK